MLKMTMCCRSAATQSVGGWCRRYVHVCVRLCVLVFVCAHECVCVCVRVSMCMSVGVFASATAAAA